MADSKAASLSANERRVLLALRDATGPQAADAVAERAGLAAAQEAVSAANWLVSKGLVSVEEEAESFAHLGEEGKAYAERGLPERRALRALTEREGAVSMAALVADGVLGPSEVPIALAWLRRKEWATIGKEAGETVLRLTDQGRAAAGGETADEVVLRDLVARGRVAVASAAEGVALLRARQNVVRVADEKRRRFALTAAGRALAPQVTVQEEIVELTRDDVASRRFERVAVRPFDVSTAVPAAPGGRPHPLVLLIGKIREVFVELGFAELEGPFVESAFWNMDALYIPQDHPAREMQDTFYLDAPASLPVPKGLARTVRDVQLRGGSTGSTGWGGSWSDDESRRALLRTHTTVTTIRYLSEHPRPPAKMFGIGRVFRKEALDATHLPEFHQVEGIVVEEGANFRMLQGVLGEFYRRMGFPDIKFRPSYYPYTEPSLDVAVKWGGRWLELGGAGIFRPEVTEPLGVPCPVLAWGLGLERLAMLTFGLQDIRQLYLSDVDWLRSAPVTLPEPNR